MTIKVFVTVGTDHHPFDRLVEWVDAWAAGRSDIDLFVQHGATSKSRVGRNQQFLNASEVEATYSASDIVVSQVGPGSIADANRAGIVPIVVPRDPALGEVVDTHQFDFGRFMAAKGRAEIVTTEAELCARLDAAISQPSRTGLDVRVTSEEAAAAVGTLAETLVAMPPSRLDLARVLTMVRRARTAS